MKAACPLIQSLHTTSGCWMEGDQHSSRGGGGNRGGSRGHKQGRGRGRGGRPDRGGFSGSLTNLPNDRRREAGSSSKGKDLNNGTSNQTDSQAHAVPLVAAPSLAIADPSPSTADTTEAELCFICAEPVQLYSVAPCNHRTCHVCAIRLRALYKKKECTFCKVSPS
jgi:hypothetical protein